MKFKNNRLGRLYITKEIIKPCHQALLFLKSRIDTHGMGYDKVTRGLEIEGESHLFDFCLSYKNVPWYYPVVCKNPVTGKGLVVMGLVKSEYEWT